MEYEFRVFRDKLTCTIVVLVNPAQGFAPYEKISHIHVPQAHMSAVLLRCTISKESYNSIGIQGSL